jgi:adenosylcobinamide-GDP ribazoletransferase
MFDDDDKTTGPMQESQPPNEWKDDLQSAAAFLTRLPMGASARIFDLRRAARAFPIAGAVIGAAGAGVLIIGGVLGMSPLLASAFTIAALLIITGALHEDGLADTADGFWGAADRERKLEIMRDSRIGTFGVLALVMSIVVRITALGQIADAALAYAALALVAAETLSRHGIVALMADLPPARSDGMAAAAGSPEAATSRSSLVIALIIAVPTLWLAAGMGGLLVAGVLAGAAFLVVRNLARRHIGGQTGDVCGAVQQLMSIAILTGVALATG